MPEGWYESGRTSICFHGTDSWQIENVPGDRSGSTIQTYLASNPGLAGRNTKVYADSWQLPGTSVQLHQSAPAVDHPTGRKEFGHALPMHENCMYAY